MHKVHTYTDGQEKEERGKRDEEEKINLSAQTFIASPADWIPSPAKLCLHLEAA